MRVVIETKVFARPGVSAELGHLFGLGLQGRHRIQVEDDRAPEFMSWLKSVGRELRESYEQVVDAGYELDSREPSRHEVRVAAVEEPDFSRRPPRLPLGEALRMLSRPFRVVLEHRGADRAFVLCMCNPQQRDFLLGRERDGYIEFESGNGLESMQERAEELGTERHGALLSWFLFDSDALRPRRDGEREGDNASVPSKELKRICEEAGLPHHQTRRRFIESYLPLRTLAGWVHLVAGREGKELRRRRQESFCRLTPAQRHHFNMKEGFKKDEGRLRNGEKTDSLYDSVSEDDRRVLGHGLDKRVAELYEPPGDKVLEADLKDDGGWAEMNPVVSALVACVR